MTAALAHLSAILPVLSAFAWSLVRTGQAIGPAVVLAASGLGGWAGVVRVIKAMDGGQAFWRR